MYCLCVFESILEACVFCFSVDVMYACKVRPGGSEPCLLVIYKEDKELRDTTRQFVSIIRKIDEGYSSVLLLTCSAQFEEHVKLLY